MTRIAVVGMACRYPDAAGAAALWENCVAGRRAFRRLPDVRMRLADYWDPDPSTPDRFYASMAAVLQGYEFDRVAYRIAGSTYRATDLTHWLALDVAAMALADAGFPMGEGLPRERTAVVVGNSLTGEFSRANQLRLRWPYVARTLTATMSRRGFASGDVAQLLEELEPAYKAPFPAVDEDSLAGALSNTIAGRICNYFDLKGGGYTVDGACSSSLLSVITACRSIVDGEVDIAIAGGVDLSIDPFEIIGFAKTGALATGEMRVYDRGANGFWPGEGCGMLVLMSEERARAGGHRVYASIAGWGISSDGKGGLTRPEVGGYRLALSRAYDRAGFGIDTVTMFEGHGTGTKVGDETELSALAAAREAADPQAEPAVIGSIKAMIGHTKAAAGVAGLIKAAFAVHHEVLPPAGGCRDPHELLTGPAAQLRVLARAAAWPEQAPVRAGVTAMGFGGINTHVVLERGQARTRGGLSLRARSLASSLQDAELLLVDATTPKALRERVAQLSQTVADLSYAQLGDLAAAAYRQLRALPWRAAVVATSPEQARAALAVLDGVLAAGGASHRSPDGTALLGQATGPARIGLLFPGQGSGRGVSGGALRRRLDEVEQVYLAAGLPDGADVVATEVAQPRIVTGAMAGLRALSTMGIEAAVAVGHSLGEIAALHWAGVMDEQALLRVARTRGTQMAAHSASGTMASVGAGADEVRRLTAGLDVVVAGYNGPSQTVLAGTVDAVEQACRLAWSAGLNATRLAVSHAFHSPLVAPAARSFAAALAQERFGRLTRRVISTVTAAPLDPGTDVVALLCAQITEPVQFAQAIELAAREVDLFLEVGPGRVLSGLVAASTGMPAVALDTDDESLTGLLRVVAAAFVAGAPGVGEALFHDRLARPLPTGAAAAFLESPCEQAPSVPVAVAPLDASTPRPSMVDRSSAGPGGHTAAGGEAAPAAPGGPVAGVPAGEAESSLALLRRLAAQRAELPLAMVHPDSRLLDDLHLSSITVGQLANQVAKELGVGAAQVPASFATATIRELAAALDAGAGAPPVAAATVDGAGSWIRAWTIDFETAPVPPQAQPQPDGGDPAGATPAPGGWRVYADDDHPLADPLRRALEHSGVGAGVLVCLPPQCPRPKLRLALYAAKAAAAGGAGDRFVLVQSGRGAAGLAKTLRQEAPALRVCVVHLPEEPVAPAAAAGWVVAEVAAGAPFVEVFYDAEGVRRVPRLRVLPARPARTVAALNPDDVLLVTGGGKGITAECALALARDSGASLALLGRSDPEQDQALAANLARMAAAGVRVWYERADVTDPAQVRRAVHELVARLGPVTALMHGAGRNEPTALSNLDIDELERTLAAKVDGLQAVVDALEPQRLRLLVTLGSIIGRAGLRGEGHYAVANEWLAELTAQLAGQYPGCRCLCLEWSVWSGVGMGERLSVVDSLARDGVSAISPEQGVAILRRLLADPDTPSPVLVSGRTGIIDTLEYKRSPLPLLRFVGRPLVHYPGAELVAEVELNAGTDLYLADHRLDDNLLFPAVFGLEAMAQVAAALTGSTDPPSFEQVELLRPIVVPPAGATTIRVAAVVADMEQADLDSADVDVIDVAIRSGETGFAVEHFRARLRCPGSPAPDGPPEQVRTALAAVPLDPAADLYGAVLFQGARFQRLRRYHLAAARHVDADVAAVDATWFAAFLPATLLLGDPGVRDALMHGNQVCVPDATLLPAGVERIYPGGAALASGAGLRYCATERSQDGDTYIYDIALRTAAGTVVERWDGLRLRAVRKTGGAGPWVPALLGPYLQRGVGDLLGAAVAIAVEPVGAAGAVEAAELALARASGELGAGNAGAVSQAAGIALAVAGGGVVGCAVVGYAVAPAETEDVAEAEEGGEARARLEAVRQCLRQVASRQEDEAPRPLTQQRRGWLVYAAGGQRVATFTTTLRAGDGRPPAQVVLAVLAEAAR